MHYGVSLFTIKPFADVEMAAAFVVLGMSKPFELLVIFNCAAV